MDFSRQTPVIRVWTSQPTIPGPRISHASFCEASVSVSDVPAVESVVSDIARFSCRLQNWGKQKDETKSARSRVRSGTAPRVTITSTYSQTISSVGHSCFLMKLTSSFEKNGHRHKTSMFTDRPSLCACLILHGTQWRQQSEGEI